MNQQEQHQFNTRRFRKDWLTRRVVTAFGWLVLATFLLLIWHIFSNAFPLFKSPHLSLKNSLVAAPTTNLAGVVELSSGLSVLGVDSCDLVLLEPAESDVQVSSNAPLDTTLLNNELIDKASQQPSKKSIESNADEMKRFPFSCQHQILFPQQGSLSFVGIITPRHLFELHKLSYENGEYALTLQSSIALDSVGTKEDSRRIIQNTGTQQASGWQFSMSGNFVILSRLHERKLASYWFDIKHPDGFQFKTFSDVDLYAVIPRTRQLLSLSGNMMSVIDNASNEVDRQLLSTDVKRIFMSPSQRSFFTQDSQHVLSKWIIQNQQGHFVFRQNTVDMSELEEDIAQMVFDGDSNAALLMLAPEPIKAEHSTTDVLITGPTSAQVPNLASFALNKVAFANRLTNEVFAPRDLSFAAQRLQWFGKQVYALHGNLLHTLDVQDRQGVTTLKSLFSEVWYEGYEQPAYVWQTSSAAENYETKFSIIPLVIGSLKASLLALFVAIPLALGAAIYTSFFAEPSVRQYLKPAIEMLEAVPSVVIGFIAAVWMVPIAEEFLLSVILFVVALPFLLVAAALLQAKVANILNDKFDARWEILFIVLAVLVLGLFCFSLSDVWRFLLFGSVESGLQSNSILNISKTTIVVAIALGVAISPSIYSLAEDALFEVPDSIKQASFALGATKLQTLRRVIIVVAMPSILSAVMLGFGRAFGETMIVLMVTGNTPISDWNILEGLRSMTANLAIELQESNVNSSHFNTLFLTASILFIFTFIVNTAAEILRNRLRKVYTDA